MRIPITIISGFAQSGKTAYLTEVLRKDSTRHRAVIMNDIAEVVTGCDHVRGALRAGRDTLTTMPNGCICCTLEVQFLRTIQRCIDENCASIFVESNATAEPSLLRSMLEKSSFADRVRITSLTTVINAKDFFRDYMSADSLKTRGLVAMSEDDRTVGEVIAEQIEHADTIVIRSTNDTSADELSLLRSLLTSLNPTAKIAPEMKDATRNDTLIEKIEFTALRPFQPMRLSSLLKSDAFRGILRADGIAWIASRNDMRILWSQTGRITTIEPYGSWWTIPVGEDASCIQDWFEEQGHRYQHLTFYGLPATYLRLQARLSECLLNDEEMSLGADLWKHFPDELGEWSDDMDRSSFLMQTSSQHS